MDSLIRRKWFSSKTYIRDEKLFFWVVKKFVIVNYKKYSYNKDSLFQNRTNFHSHQIYLLFKELLFKDARKFQTFRFDFRNLLTSFHPHWFASSIFSCSYWWFESFTPNSMLSILSRTRNSLWWSVPWRLHNL